MIRRNVFPLASCPSPLAWIPTYPFLLFLALARLAVASAFTRATFFRCFLLVLRSFSRPVAIVSPNCKKWSGTNPSPSPCASLYNTRLCTPQAMCVPHFALRGTHPHAKMRRTSGRMLKKSASVVLGSSKSSTYPGGYASGFDSSAALLDKLFEHPAGTVTCCATHMDRLVFGFNTVFL